MMPTSTLTIGARALSKLVDPVVPFAADDSMLPVLNAVRIESRGTHLLAFATDRYRLTAHRVAAQDGTQWPEFSATIPLSVLKSIKAMFKPAVRGMDTDLDLTIGEDEVLEVTAAGGLVDLLGATTRYRLVTGEWPIKSLSIITDAIARTAEQSSFGADARLLADYGRVGIVGGLSIKAGVTQRDPIVVTDGADFISVLMPRRMHGADGLDFPKLDDWAPLLAPVEAKAAPKKRAAKKGAAA